ncbi:hypothetical protein BD311DRAFT_205132 [Dichomitus squalens]|uniref:Uncharacterized protein n=1 Tax=Dichomitus squalens TaxID=114155 RepID=A0A4Q9N3J1_9APHY|nr:hypothetical protein BD311DRAFT_205132 [Dichomitus squalens]
MPPSNSNRKSFSLSLNLPLARRSSNSRPQKDRSRKTVPPPSREFSSPRNPLFPPSLPLKQEQPVLPLSLTDALDPSEKMKLLRKTKKLSRILGEMPIPVAINEASSQTSTPTDSPLGLFGLREEACSPASSSATSTVSLVKQQQPGMSLMGSLKRSITIGHGKAIMSQQSGVQRARSLASYPVTSPLPESVTTQTSPISRVGFARPEKPLPGIDDAREAGVPSATSSSRRDSLLSLSSIATARRRNSTSSSILVVERTLEQLQRARAAKPTRQLGENVPPDVLLRASSPPPRTPLAPSPSFSSFADSPMDVHDLQRSVRSGASTKRDCSRRRRLSLDVQTLGGRNPEAASSEAVAQRAMRKNGRASTKMRPSTADTIERSLSRRPSMMDDSDMDSDMDLDNVRSLSLEKKRALNVRRARKMAQMFGNDPPLALFQVTTVPARVADASFSGALGFAERSRCDSNATWISVTPSDIPAQPPIGDDDKRISDRSPTRNLSPLIFANPHSGTSSNCTTPYPGDILGDAESELLPYLNPEQDSVSDLCPASPLDLPPLAYPLSYPSQTNISVASSISVPPFSATPSEHSQAPLTSPTRSAFRAPSPPLVLNKLQWDAPLRSVSAPTSPPTVHSQLAPLSSLSAVPSGPVSALDLSASDPMFRMRRLRAAKLSRFFGVGMNDISGMLVSTDSLPSSPAGGAGTDPSICASPRSVSTQLSSSHTLSLSHSYSRTHHGDDDNVPPVPPVPPLEAVRTPSAETDSAPPSPCSPCVFSEPDYEEGRSRKSFGGGRSRSASRLPTCATSQPSQPAVQPRQPSVSSVTDTPAVADRNGSHSEHAALALQALTLGRPHATVVEVAAEYRKSRYFFRESRQPKTKELEMQAAIKQLRKIR